jgi:hypothetical protein
VYLNLQPGDPKLDRLKRAATVRAPRRRAGSRWRAPQLSPQRFEPLSRHHSKAIKNVRLCECCDGVRCHSEVREVPSRRCPAKLYHCLSAAVFSSTEAPLTYTYAQPEACRPPNCTSLRGLRFSNPLLTDLAQVPLMEDPSSHTVERRPRRADCISALPASQFEPANFWREPARSGRLS